MLSSKNTGEVWRARDRLFVVAAWCGLAALILGGASCKSQQRRTVPWEPPVQRLVWPPPPEQPRVEYLGAMPATAEPGWGIGFGERVAGFLFGKGETKMVKPVAVAKNEAGLIAVVDTSVPTLHFFDLARRKYWRLEGRPASFLRSPVGLAVDDEGRTYVSDSVQRKVFVYANGRNLSAELGNGTLSRPTGLALSPGQDRLYVVDTVACKVVIFDRAGRSLGSFGERGTLPGQFNAPTYIATAPDGNICVSDSLNFRVQVFRPDGTHVRTFGNAGDGAGDFARPKGIGVDTFGRIYVVDAAFENVQIFDSDGTLLLALGGPGTGPGEFALPCGLFLDSSNTIWVADSYNQRVQVFRLLEDAG